MPHAKNKHIKTAAAYMIAGMLLLAAVQGFWLYKSWMDERQKLRRELSLTLREVVMRDQLRKFTGKIQSDRDSIIKSITTRLAFVDTGKRVLQIARTRGALGEGMPLRQPDGERRRGSDSRDSGIIGKITVTAHYWDSTLVKDSMAARYKAALQREKLPTHFTITTQRDSSNMISNFVVNVRTNGAATSTASGVFRTDSLIKSPSPEYQIKAVFNSPAAYLFRQIGWPLLLSVLLLAIIGSAFRFLYRNLIQQHKLAQIKNDFIGNITHELKTPIATISVALEAIKGFSDRAPHPKTDEYIDISNHEVQRLNMLVDKVLKLSMFEQQKMELHHSPFDARQLTDDVVNNMKLQIEKFGAVVDVHTTGNNFILNADKAHIQSVLYNLLENALKYSGNAPRVQINLTDKGNTLELSIADNGPGIPEEYHDKLFEKFFRVPNGNRHNIKGYGLGLSYVAEVIKRHNGHIRVQSKPGQGSAFIIELTK